MVEYPESDLPAEAKCPRKALIIFVGWPTQICRVRNSIARATRMKNAHGKIEPDVDNLGLVLPPFLRTLRRLRF